MQTNLIELNFKQQKHAFERFWTESSDTLLRIAETIFASLSEGGKLLLFGNGGSAADAQHVAAEIVGRYTRERRGFPAIALTTDTSILTAVGNDYGYDTIFVRQVEALAGPGDVLAGISTSGNSPNVLNALKWGKDRGIATIGFGGKDGGKMADLCDICFVSPSDVTARIQEVHIAAWHIICDLVENAMVEEDANKSNG